MDPSLSIDLSSVAGIVALTLAIIHYLKAPIGRTKFLQEFPVAVYVVGIAGGLTWFAHDVLHRLDGDLVSLSVQAILSALAASGAVEWFRAGNKPVAETKSAVSSRNGGFYLIPILLALSLSSSACASAGKVIVEADRGIHATLSTLDDTVNRFCDAKLLRETECQSFNAALANAYAAHQRFNAAAQEGSIAGVPAMVSALEELRLTAQGMAVQAQTLIDDLQRWQTALMQLLPKKDEDPNARKADA